MNPFLDANSLAIYNLAHQLGGAVGITTAWNAAGQPIGQIWAINYAGGSLDAAAIERAIRANRGTIGGMAYDLTVLVPLDVLSSFAFNHGPFAGIWPIPTAATAATTPQPVLVQTAGGGTLVLPAGTTTADAAAAAAAQANLHALAAAGPTQPTAQTVAATTAPTPHVSITNLTTGNAALIIATHDQWRLSITGARPGVTVSVTAAKNAGQPSSSTYGTTDSAGNWSLTGTSSLSDVGAWLQNWTAGPDSAGALNFAIVAPPAATAASQTAAGQPTYTPHVIFQNITSGSSTVIVAAHDQWRITINGAPPQAPVVVTASKDGGAASSTAYGLTDNNGNFELDGTSAAADAGSWIEQWTAGGINAGSLYLQVMPPPTDPTITTAAPIITPTPAGTTDSGFLDSLPAPVQAIAQSLKTATADVPSGWIWSGVIGAAVLWLIPKGKHR